MKMTAEKLTELQSLGELQFSVLECSVILGIDNLQSVMDENIEISNAYNKGRLLSIAEVRKAILQQAKNGSCPAQKMWIDMAY